MTSATVAHINLMHIVLQLSRFSVPLHVHFIAKVLPVMSCGVVMCGKSRKLLYQLFALRKDKIREGSCFKMISFRYIAHIGKMPFASFNYENIINNLENVTK